MAVMSLCGSIRIHCLNMGTSKWKEGRCEVTEKDGRFTLVVNFNAGGAPAKFQLNQNIKTVVLRPAGGKLSRLLLTMRDSSSLTIDKVPSKEAEELKHHLDSINLAKPQTVKQAQGSASFSGILGNRSIQRESIRPLTPRSQTPTKRVIFDGRDETPIKKPQSNNGRIPGKTSPTTMTPSHVTTLATSTPHRTGLMETSTNKGPTDYGRKFLSSSREKQLNVRQAEENRPGLLPLQSSSFYSSRLTPREYSGGISHTERTPGSSQPPSAKRSLVLPAQSGHLSVKRLRPSQDYSGWNKPRVLSTQPQQLQGFSNLGNTCYMNSILQSLFSLQPFSNDLLRQGIPYRKIPLNALIRRFAFLLAKKDVCSAEMKKDLLKKVKNAISATAERFSGYMQNDAHEFLSQCLDQLKEDMGKLNKTWRTESSSGDDRSGSGGRCGEEMAGGDLYSCPIICNFEFEAQHSIICKTCGERLVKRETFNDLSIDLPRRKKVSPPRSIQDSLNLFFRKEDVEYSCEKCSGRSAVVIHKFSRLPRVLILHLKRYSFNVSLSLNNKVGQQVVIPRYLTLSWHCMESTRPPLPIGYSTSAANFQPLKTSQMVNSCNSSPAARKQPQQFGSMAAIRVDDSESEEEILKRSVINHKIPSPSMRNLSDKKSMAKSGKCLDPADSSFNEVNDDEMLTAVLEVTKKEASRPVPSEEEEKLASSPDTGFGGDDDVQEIVESMETVEEETSKAQRDPAVYTAAALPSDPVKDFDENKENKTPGGSQNNPEWLRCEQEREEQELQEALVQSLQEQEAREQKEDDDLKRATELSLQEYNSFFLDGTMSDEDSGNEEVLDMDYTEEEAEELKRNAESGELAHSYRLVSVVSHIGSSSSSGHYISDVFCIKKQAWLTYNDLAVSRTQEATVQTERDRSGYIFFYMHKEIFDELVEEEKKAQTCGTDPNRPSRPSL